MASSAKSKDNKTVSTKNEWHLGDFEDRKHSKNIEVKALPRLRVPISEFCDQLKTTKCKFPQNRCNHINPYTAQYDDCSRFYHDIENTRDATKLTWLRGLSDQWHQSTKDEKLLMLSQWVFWRKPANKPKKQNVNTKTNAKINVNATTNRNAHKNINTNTNTNAKTSKNINKTRIVSAKGNTNTNTNDNTTKNTDVTTKGNKSSANNHSNDENDSKSEITPTRTNRFPKNYDIYLWGENGYDTYKICIKYLCHILQCGISSLYTLITALWNCRSQGQLIPKTSFKYEGRVCKWLPHFENYMVKNYDFVGCHYINRNTPRLYIEKKNGKSVTLKDIYWDWMSDLDPHSHEYHLQLQVCMHETSLKK